MAQWLPGSVDFSLPLLQRILAARGIAAPEEFCAPSWERGLHPATAFRDMAKAVARLRQALQERECVAIAGDYDVDGVAAAALLVHLFRFLQAPDPVVLLPHRVRDGFGLTPQLVERAHAAGATLIITVDNGITAAEAVARATALGIGVIITDHHSPTGPLPEGMVALIDPALPDEPYPFDRLAGAGVAWKLADALLETLAAAGELDPAARAQFGKWNLDLVALATVADVVDLVGENRVLVHYGLGVLAQTRKPGLQQLCAQAQVEMVNAQAVAFRLGPRLNAAGRLEDARLAFELLTTGDEDEAVSLAERLEALNRERQGLVKRALAEAGPAAARQLAAGERVIIVENGTWHPGIIGLIAGKLSEAHNRPVLAFTRAAEDGAWVASCRSVPAFDLTAMLIRFHDFFTRSGGHALAAGLTVPADRLPLFRESLWSWAREVLTGEVPEPEFVVDCRARPEELTLANSRALLRLEPFGQGNREPLLQLDGIELFESRRIGKDQDHFRCSFRTPAGRCVVIGFGMGDCAERFPAGTRVDILGHLRENEYQGYRSPQLVLRDMRPAAS